jgi:hypothetical protein
MFILIIYQQNEKMWFKNLWDGSILLCQGVVVIIPEPRLPLTVSAVQMVDILSDGNWVLWRGENIWARVERHLARLEIRHPLVLILLHQLQHE